jgi:hypothetical protein
VIVYYLYKQNGAITMTYITYPVGTELKTTSKKTGKTQLWTVAKVDGEVMTFTKESCHVRSLGAVIYYTETRKLKILEDNTSEEVAG